MRKHGIARWKLMLARARLTGSPKPLSATTPLADPPNCDLTRRADGGIYWIQMTPEERFERIERTLIGLTDAQRGLVEAQRMQAETLSGLMQMIGSHVTSADARMKRIEENLDGLIRAITAEHRNGKTGG
jgi:hypothetical protein